MEEIVIFLAEIKDPYIQSRLLKKELNEKEVCLILRRVAYILDKESLQEHE